MRILVVGAEGQLGRSLMERADVYGIAAVGKDRIDMDVADRGSVQSVFKNLRPECVINASAYTAVDAAETDRQRAFGVNEHGVRHLIECCEPKQIPLVHVSTDFIFDGRSKTPYLENAIAKPLNVYGMSKLAGEHALSRYKKSLLIRTSWVFSRYGENFVKTMLNLGSEREMLTVVSDQIGCPTPARALADAILKMLVMIPDMLAEERQPWGVYHFCGQPEVSWFQFAEEVFRQAREAEYPLKLKHFSAIKAADYPAKAKRPAYSVLDCQKIKTTFGIERPDWRHFLNEIITAEKHAL
ncbi:MAG: dTDP-4-dehydrorhamnose reductase [Gammaproteobacteria bacterium]|nr:MAG: dTDP-4-dehydrorhamnose reductase [Gammaproteobacteria bacterium]